MYFVEFFSYKQYTYIACAAQRTIFSGRTSIRSKTSSVRKVSGDRIITLAGKGLFEFGYRDGAIGNALLQHPPGIVHENGCLWIADTYNNRLRMIDLSASVIVTAAGTDRDGLLDGPGERARFDEPGGVSYTDGRVYIADTNNHVIRVFDTRSRKVWTFDLYETASVPEGTAVFRVKILPPEGISSRFRCSLGDYRDRS